jgi:hypothetical protein
MTLLLIRKLCRPLSALFVAGSVLFGCAGCEYADDEAPINVSTMRGHSNNPPSFAPVPTPKVPPPNPEAVAAQDRNSALIRTHLAAAGPGFVSGAGGTAGGVSTSTGPLIAGNYTPTSECLGASEGELVVEDGITGVVLLHGTFPCGQPVTHQVVADGILSISTRVTDEDPP